MAECLVVVTGGSTRSVHQTDLSKTSPSRRGVSESVLRRLDLLSIRNSLPEGIEIYERIIINHVNDLESMVRSTDSLAIEEMKMNQEELKVRVSFGKFFASLVLMITLHFVIERLALQYIEEIGTTTFITAGLLVGYGIFVFFLMKRMHYSWAEYGFTLANWRPCLADALVQVPSLLS